MPEKLLTFIHISDTHIHVDADYTSDHIDFSSRQPVQALIDTINNLEAEIDFVLHTGDVTHNPEAPEHYHVAREILKQIKYPVHYIPGNHDNVEMFQSAFLGFAPHLIRPTYDYQFEVNGVQIVMIDSHRPAEESGAYGWLTDEQLTWLDNICNVESEQLLVVGIHHNALPTEAPWLDTIMLKNGDVVHSILRKAQKRLRGVFYGHIHESIVTVRDGISYYSVQSAWFQTQTWFGAEEPVKGHIHNPGYNLVTLTDTDTFVRFRRVSL